MVNSSLVPTDPCQQPRFVLLPVPEPQKLRERIRHHEARLFYACRDRFRLGLGVIIRPSASGMDSCPPPGETDPAVCLRRSGSPAHAPSLSAARHKTGKRSAWVWLLILWKTASRPLAPLPLTCCAPFSRNRLQPFSSHYGKSGCDILGRM